MTDRLLADLPAAIKHWQNVDVLLSTLGSDYAPEHVGLTGAASFTSLAESITPQQVSLAAGRAIWGRVETVTGGRKGSWTRARSFCEAPD